MFALHRFLGANSLLRFSRRLGSWLGDFDEVGISPRFAYDSRHADANQLDRKLAIMCYLSVFGWLVAYRTPRHQRGPLANFHLRQMGLLLLLSISILLAQVILIPFFGWGSMVVAGVGLSLTLLLRMLGVMAAMSGQQEPLPLIGQLMHRFMPRS